MFQLHRLETITPEIGKEHAGILCLYTYLDKSLVWLVTRLRRIANCTNSSLRMIKSQNKVSWHNTLQNNRPSFLITLISLWFKVLHWNYNHVILMWTDFLRTNLTKFAVICVKRRQKAGFLSPRSSKISVTKKKETRKRESEEKRKKQWLHS